MDTEVSAELQRPELDGRSRAQQALDNFDAYPLLESVGAVMHTGATGNNLRDLRLLLAVTTP